MADTKKCDQCKYLVPKAANVCGHCGARFVKYQDKSFFGRIGAIIKYGLTLSFLGGLGGYMFASPTAAVIAGFLLGLLGALVGLFGGLDREKAIAD
jgi:hypothetical protein